MPNPQLKYLSHEGVMEIVITLVWKHSYDEFQLIWCLNFELYELIDLKKY